MAPFVVEVGGPDMAPHAPHRSPPRPSRDAPRDRGTFRHAARAPRRPAATSTTHESAVSTPTSTSAVVSSPVCTAVRSEEHTSELQSRLHLVCRLLLEKKK